MKREELIKLLSERKGSFFLTLTARTDPRLKKTGNPFGKIVKVSRVNACVNFHYDDGVVRRLEKEGKSIEDFKRGESWHTPVFTSEGYMTPFCQHKKTGETYLRAQKLAILQVVYLNEEGKEVEESAIAPFLPAENHYDNQGLDRPLEFVVYKLESLAEIVFEGETYSLSDK